MRNISIAVGLALMLAVTPAEAKHGTKIKTVVGCVEGTPHHYQLAATTKKGKHKVYDLVGDRDFQAEVGHRVQAQGAVSGQNFKIAALKTVASTCR